MKIGKRIKLARERRGLTLKEVGDEVGISQQAVHQWEVGKPVGKKKKIPMPSIEKLVALADKLKVPVRWLLDDDLDDALPAPDGLEAKIEKLDAIDLASIRAMVDHFLEQQELRRANRPA